MPGYTGAAGTNQGSWNGNGGGTGLTTGANWKGNTAYGPAGGMASGYATRDAASLAAAGMGPTQGQYGNFRSPSGAQMYGGYGGTGFNAQQAAAGANAQYQAALAAAAARAAQQRVPGILSGPTPIAQQPLPPIQQPVPAPVVPTGMPVAYDSLRAAVGPDYYRQSTAMNDIQNSAYYGTVGNLGDYMGGDQVNRTSKGDLGGGTMW